MTDIEQPPLVDIEQTLQQAVEHHRAGRQEEAVALYQSILEADPCHAEANNNMGAMAVQVKQPAAGLPYFVAALEADPSRERYWLNYIDALAQADQLETARDVLTLARQQGLQGEEVDALAMRLEGGTAVAEKPKAKPAKPDKPTRKSAAYKGGSPGPKEMNSLVTQFGQGHFAEAATLAQAMTMRFPQHEFGWKALGMAYKQMGRTADALVPMQKAATLSPRDVKAHFNLGVTLQELGRLGEAEASYRRALEINPDYVEARINLGNTLKDLGRAEEAEASYRQALQARPDSAEAHQNLGITLQDRGRPAEAESCFRRALEIKPDYTEAHSNLGIVFMNLGRPDEAEASFRRALATNPEFTQALSNLGVAQKELGQLDEAMESCHRALEINPDYAEAHNNLGTMLMSLGRRDEAEASYRRALRANPDFAKAHSNLSIAQKDLGQLDEAMASCQRALEINPESAETHLNLGNVLQDSWRLDEAIASYRRALELKPDFAPARSNLLFCLSHDETVGVPELFAEHRRFGEQFEANLRASWPQHGNSRDPERCLQVGFVSADLYDHSVAFFIEPVLAHLATCPQLSLHAFYNNAIQDLVTGRLRKHLKHWHSIVGLPDEMVAQQVRDAGIDILIDLAGHTGANRLLTFARRPAPIQASWMGYPGTSGMQSMDYYIADRFFMPYEGFSGQFTEAIARLPANAPFLPSQEAPAVNVLPALSNGYITFGSFNRAGKIRRSVVALWARLLRALPSSRLLLAGMPASDKEDTLTEWFAQEGIERGRLSFHTRSDMTHYLGLHHQVDVCLDTFPYNGGTTTLHALWMGVPTLTLTGDTPASRTGACVLGHVGLDAFVAYDAEDFVNKGVSWADNLAALQDIRAGLRERFAESAMSQPELIAESLQRALRIMWQRWCKGLPAKSFEVTGQAQAMRPA
jgi:predicted O-linked N-acetylglucosamine transferase (SPINDLY family)